MVSRLCFCRCCLIHDRCYDDIIAKNTCDTKVVEALYVITYIRDGCTGCGKWYTFIYLIKNLKPYSIQFNDGCYCKLQSKTAQGWGTKSAKVPDFD